MGKTYKSRAHSITTTCRGEISYQPISIREGLLGCWRTGHGDHRPTLRARAFYLENWFLITGYNVSRHYFACFWGLKANESYQYLVPITTVLRRRLLQYFIGDYCSTSQGITAVLGRDYCSTWYRLLQYLGQVLAQKGLTPPKRCRRG